VRVRSEQPPYSILNRGVERDVLPVAERYGMGTLVFSPLANGMLTGRVRKDRPSQLNRSGPYFAHFTDESRLDVVEQLVPLAEKAGVPPLTHLALAFVLTHPGVTSAIIGPRTAEQLDDLLAAADLTLPEEILDRIDEIVPPGADVGSFQMSYQPPAVTTPALRRRSA
jgi:aryl-alcohol dehydrogenase-like predicted oxidoreductase